MNMYDVSRCRKLELAETTDNTERKLARQLLPVAFGWYLSRCGLAYIKLLVHDRNASVKTLGIRDQTWLRIYLLLKSPGIRKKHGCDYSEFSTVVPTVLVCLLNT